jgi:transcriptional regulator with XRE-family HTH domain
MPMKQTRQMDDRTSKLIKKMAKNIKSLRLERGLTQEDMAELGFGPRWYQRFESGRHVPSLPTLIKLARAFKIDVSEFFK